MPVFRHASEIVIDDVFIDISEELALLGHNVVYLKLEGLNTCGSIKLKTARAIVARLRAERSRDNLRLIESSSGNLGIALATICAEQRIPFECVVDINALPEKCAHIRSLGAKITLITEPDKNGGYLGSRIAYIERRLAEDDGLIWTNQYGNIANAMAHYETTAPAIVGEIGAPDYLFVGAGTTGTLLGCLRYFREHAPSTKIVAVDAIGSITFGAPAAKRYIPGIGTSRRPELLDSIALHADEVVHVHERDAVRVCREIGRRAGLLLGGSSGSVLFAAQEYLRDRGLRNKRIVVISPDLGSPYLSTVYNDDWVDSHYPNAAPVPLQKHEQDCAA